jgi:hypothetical protein
VLERLKHKRHPAALPPSHGERQPGEMLRRLERAAENLNPILIIIVIGLVIMDLSVFAALELRQLPLWHISAASGNPPAKPLTFTEVIGLPRR